MKYSIPAVIFAGGKSRRMGKDKSLLPFGDYDTLSQYQYLKLKSYFDEVYLSAKTDKFHFECRVIQDNYKESSPLVAIISAFEQLEHHKIFILSVDAPMIDKDIVQKLFDACNKDSSTDAIIAQSPSGLQPLCGIYKKSILPLAKKNLKTKNHSLKKLLESSLFCTVRFEDESRFVNLNTKEEYLKLLARIN